MPTTFEKLIERYRIRATIRTETALRIGAGKSLDMTGTDLPIVRDGMGRPYIPGSSFKGAARSSLEAIIRGLPKARIWTCDPLADPCTAELDEKRKALPSGQTIRATEITSTVCTLCSLFGSCYLAGRLFVHDLPVIMSSHMGAVLRDGVGIDRDLERSATGLKYDYEVVNAGTEFSLTMLLENPDPVELALTLKILELLDQGEILLGGFTSRGLGRVALSNAPEVERTTPDMLLTGCACEKKNYAQLQRDAGQALQAALS